MTSDTLDCAYKPSPEAFFVAVGSETVLLQARRGVYYGMNDVGTRIWEGLNAGEAVRQTCGRIAGDFDVELETIERDARAFLDDLVTNDLVIVG